MDKGEKDANLVQDEAMDALEELRGSAFFKKLQNKVRSNLRKSSVDEEEKNRIFNLFQGGSPDEESERRRKALEDSDLDLEECQKNRLPIVNYILNGCFHVAVFVNFMSSLFESYHTLRADAVVHSQIIEGSFNCMNHIHAGTVLEHTVNIIQAGMSIILLFTRKKKQACIFLAFIFVQILHAVVEFTMIVYRIRLTTVSIFRWPSPIAVSILREIVIFLIIIAGVLMAMQRYYDLAGPVTERERRLHAESYGKRFLNDQIIYRNAPSFLQRKYVLRKATAFQIYSVLRSILEESSTRHKRGQTIKFDPIFTKEHVRKAKHDETLIENFTDEEIVELIKGRSAVRVHNLEKNREKRLKDILENVKVEGPKANK